MNNSSEKVERHYAASEHEDKDAEGTENDKYRMLYCIQSTKGNYSPHATRHPGVIVLQLPVDKTGGVTYCNKGGERR